MNLIRGEDHSPEKLEELINYMDGRLRTRIVERVRESIMSQENVLSALRDYYPFLSEAESQVCYWIIKGKTVSEICEIRHVSPSTVTSMRSRLRGKMKLSKQESLRSHLLSIVNRSYLHSIGN